MDIHTYYRLYPELRKRAWQRCYAATELMRIFVARANSEPSKIGGIDFPAGSLFILPSELYERIGMHPLVYDDAMRRLLDEGDITVTEYHFNRIITLTHYPTEPEHSSPAQAEHSPPAQPEHSSLAPNLLTDHDVRAQYIAAARAEHPTNHAFAPLLSLYLKPRPVKPKTNIRAGPHHVHA